MNNSRHTSRIISVALTIAFLTSPILGQQRRSSPRKPAQPARSAPAPTFDTLLAADSYRIYVEVRGVGQLIRSPALTDLLDPVMKLGGPPKEFKSLLSWLNSQADALAGSRMMVASWASRPGLPFVLMAIEFDSPEEAQKFDPKLRNFIPKLLPTPTPSPTPTLSVDDSSKPVIVGPPSATPPTNSGPSLPPYVIKQAGSLILISDKPFAFKDLAPRNSKLLSEDQHFATSRNRFASESLFVFVDLQSIQKEQEEQHKKHEESMAKAQAEATSRPTPEEQFIDPEAEAAAAALQAVPTPEVIPEVEVAPQNPPVDSGAALSSGEDPRVSGAPEIPFYALSSLLFGGSSNWAEALGFGIAFEGDAYVLRALIINGPDSKAVPIPFMPQFISGPSIVPESPSIFPSDTDFFVAMSLDYPQVYEGVLKSFAMMDEVSKKYGGRPVSAPAPVSPFAIYEQRLGLKIRDDLLPLLGNEIALGLLPPLPKAPEPETTPDSIAGSNKEKKPAPAPDPNPVIAIALKDREAMRKLIPRIIESLGFKGASLLAQTEKRGETEIVSYGGAFAYAFVQDFLVVSAEPGAIRQTVDSFLSHQTLTSNSQFRNATRWQPRQLLGQFYVAPDLVERYYPIAMAGVQGQDRMREFMSRLSLVLDPLSYSLTNDGLGPLHELHVPRNMLMILVTGLAGDAGGSEAGFNESAGRNLLRTIHAAETTFKATRNDDRYGTLEELTNAGLLEHGLPMAAGYRLEIRISGNKFEATAVPAEYGKTGFLSYFIDESGVLRGGDHGGGPATVADNPIQ